MKCRFILLFLLSFSVLSQAEAIKVSFASDGRLLRGGQPYFIKGAGGHDHMDELARRGGNSFRTWGEGDLPGALEMARRNNLTLCAGLWLEKECSWFSYKNPEHCTKQLERVRKLIRQYRDEPEILLWGLGNESDGGGGDDAFWQQLNNLARMVHEEDRAHPTLTAVAGLSQERATALNKHTPDLDLVGINTYAALAGLREHLVKIGWNRPWVVTEYGPRGFWESPKTNWDANVEQTSTEKAILIRRCYDKAIAPGGSCGGSYIFIWGQKQEATSTWFGIFNEDGESTATADVLQELWSDKAPENRAPKIKTIKCSESTLSPSDSFTVKINASDPDGDPLQYRWQITDDLRKQDNKGHEIRPPQFDGLIKGEDSTATIQAPAKPGPYRVFVSVSDGKGHVATANVPVLVK